MQRITVRFSRAYGVQALLVVIILLLFVVPAANAQGEMPETMAYQGYLTITDSGPANGTATVVFRLYNQSSSGTALWEEAQQGVRFTDGVFTVQLGAVESLEEVPFDRSLWLGVSVAGSPELTPRVALESVPYALNVRGLRTLPGDDGVPNVILGIEDNFVGEGTSGAVISGGGGTIFLANQITASYGTIGGGYANTVRGSGGTVAGGANNAARGDNATVGGGFNNQATEQWATIGGGNGNAARGQLAVVGGGDSNAAEGPFTTVGGGAFNVAQAAGATVPGGQGNWANGDHSFAAGFQARADHDGTFIWADYSSISDPAFTSTAARQFLIRARGGVGIGTNAPEEGALHVTNTESNRDLVLGGTDDTLFGDDGVLTSDPAFDSSDLWFVSNDAVLVMLDADESAESSEFIIADADLDVAFQVDLSGTVTTGHIELENELGASASPAEGGVYRDNVVYAWAHVNADGTVAASFGCTVSKQGLGRYRIDYERDLPNGMAPVVTPLSANDPVIATVSPSGTDGANVVVFPFVGGQFQAGDRPFYIQVVGRP